MRKLVMWRQDYKQQLQYLVSLSVRVITWGHITHVCPNKPHEVWFLIDKEAEAIPQSAFPVITQIAHLE